VPLGPFYAGSMRPDGPDGPATSGCRERELESSGPEFSETEAESGSLPNFLGNGGTLGRV